MYLNLTENSFYQSIHSARLSRHDFTVPYHPCAYEKSLLSVLFDSHICNGSKILDVSQFKGELQNKSFFLFVLLHILLNHETGINCLYNLEIILSHKIKIAALWFCAHKIFIIYYWYYFLRKTQFSVKQQNFLRIFNKLRKVNECLFTPAKDWVQIFDFSLHA